MPNPIFSLQPDPSADEHRGIAGAAKKRRAILAAIALVTILLVGSALVLLIRRISQQPPQLETAPISTASHTPRRPTATPRPQTTREPQTSSPEPVWRTVAEGLPRNQSVTYHITQCGGVLYLSNFCQLDDRIYALEDFRWVPVASYEAHVGPELPIVSGTYAYGDMLFVESEFQTHVKRADGSWFSLPRLDRLDAGNYYKSKVNEGHAADGLYALSALNGKVFRFENESWQPQAALPAFEHRLARLDGGWTIPYLFTVGEDLYVFCGDTDDGMLIYRLTANGWIEVTGPSSIDSFIAFEGRLHIATADKKFYRQTPEGWSNITQGVTFGNDPWAYSQYVIYENKLYLNASQNVYRRDGEVWTPLTKGLPASEEGTWRHLYATEIGLLLGAHDEWNAGYYRLGAEGWAPMTGEPWDDNRIFDIQSTNGMDFASVSGGLYRLYPDGSAERTTATGTYGNGDCDIFAYQGGYIDAYFHSHIYLNLNGEAILMEEGLPLRNLENITYHQAGQDIYAVCDDGNAALCQWQGTHWEKVADITYRTDESVVVFQDALYVYNSKGVYRVSGGETTATIGVLPSEYLRFEVTDDKLFLHTPAASFQMEPHLLWVERGHTARPANRSSQQTKTGRGGCQPSAVPNAPPNPSIPKYYQSTTKD